MYPDIPVWGKGAILNDAWFILLFQVIVNPLMNTCNPWYFAYWLRKRSVFKAVENANKKIQEGEFERQSIIEDPTQMTQGESHVKVEMPVWDPAFSFAGLVNGFFTIVFFQPLLPLSSAFGFFAFFFIYWSHKHRLLRMSNKPFTLNDSIGKTTLYIISLAIMIYGISTMIFDKFTYDKLTIPSIVIFVIGASSLFFPYYSIFGTCAASMNCYSGYKDKEERNLDKQYKTFRTYFTTEYERVNPATTAEAMEEYMNFLMSNPI